VRDIHRFQIVVPAESSASVVIPVRYVARSRVVQTTSTHLTGDFIRVRSASPPTVGSTVAMQVYLPKLATPLAMQGIVRDASFGTNAYFTAELTDVPDPFRARIAGFLAGIQGRRACGRFDVSVPVLLRDAFTAGGGVVMNLSASGLFVQTDLPRDIGARVRGEIQLPGEAGAQEFEAEVVRVAEQPKGVGLQIVGGTDEFRTRLSAYLGGLGA
jgi:PilZ domain-containing protein